MSIWGAPFLILCLFSEYLLRKIPNDYSLKANTYKERSHQIETLILGNSLSLYDLDPKYFTTSAYNGGHLAQSLDLDAALFFKYEYSMTKLKYLVVCISDMSFFSKLGKSNENWRMTNYSIYYGLNMSYDVTDYVKIFSLPFSVNRNKLISYYLKRNSAVTVDNAGFGTDYRSDNKRDLKTTAQEIARAHQINDNTYYNEERIALERIIQICLKRNIKVLLVLAPAYPDYLSLCDKTKLQITLNTCMQFKNTYKNVSYVNFLTDTSFQAPDYYDAVHLNEKGAKKMSLKVNDVLNEFN
jgi:hypothetical protein